jgi:hypothetical protein
VRVLCTRGSLRTDVWGKWLELQHEGEPALKLIKNLPPLDLWEQFLAVRDGSHPNPCPPEVGLNMALLWDAIKSSARRNGSPVRVSEVREAALR